MDFHHICYWANGLTPVQHHNASLLTMIKPSDVVCNKVSGCEVFLFMLANDAHVGAISLITTTVKTLVGPSPLHCPSHSTTPGEWVLVGWRLDWLGPVGAGVHTVRGDQKSPRLVHGAHLGPGGPKWAPCLPHKPCYQEPFPWLLQPPLPCRTV